MRKYPKIAVVILNHNGFQHTKECLNSVRKSTYNPLSIIVMDSASTDDSVNKLIQIMKPDEQLIKLSVNGGYTYGNNVGIKYAFGNGAQYVFIINNDIVMDRNCIEDLYKAISQDKTIGIIGPKVLYYSRPTIINYAGISGFIHKASYIRIGLNETDNGQYEELVDTLYQDGCALLIAKACFEKIGGFDELLWAYSEESDLCVRACLAGFRICCLQSAKVWHKVSATFGSYYNRKPHAVYYGIRNNYVFHRRYSGPYLNKLWITLKLLSRLPRQSASIVLKGKSSRIRNLWMLIVATLVGIVTNSQRPSDAFAPIKAVKTDKLRNNLLLRKEERRNIQF